MQLSAASRPRWRRKIPSSRSAASKAVPADGDEDPAGSDVQRLDKWLWFARVFRSRTLATASVTEGRVRINAVRVTKPAQIIKAGDVLTIALREKVMLLRMLQPGLRRGPATEARLLYDDLTPPPVPKPPAPEHARRAPGSGRPSKRERRQTDRLKDDA